MSKGREGGWVRGQVRFRASVQGDYWNLDWRGYTHSAASECTLASLPSFHHLLRCLVVLGPCRRSRWECRRRWSRRTRPRCSTWGWPLDRRGPLRSSSLPDFVKESLGPLAVGRVRAGSKSEGCRSSEWLVLAGGKGEGRGEGEGGNVYPRGYQYASEARCGMGERRGKSDLARTERPLSRGSHSLRYVSRPRDYPAVWTLTLGTRIARRECRREPELSFTPGNPSRANPVSFRVRCDLDGSKELPGARASRRHNKTGGFFSRRSNVG